MCKHGDPRRQSTVEYLILRCLIRNLVDREREKEVESIVEEYVKVKCRGKFIAPLLWGGRNSIILFEGFEASPDHPSDKSRSESEDATLPR